MKKITNTLKKSSEVRVIDDNGKYRFTIPLHIIKELKLIEGDFIKVNLRNYQSSTIIYSKIPNKPPSRKYLQLKRNIPKKFSNYVQKGDKLHLTIEKVNNKRSKSLY